MHRWSILVCTVFLGGLLGELGDEGLVVHDALLQHPGLRVQGSGVRSQGSGCRVQGQGSGFRVQGSGFRVQGSEFRVHAKIHHVFTFASIACLRLRGSGGPRCPSPAS